MHVAPFLFFAVLALGCTQRPVPESASSRPQIRGETGANGRARAIDLAAADALRRKLPFAGASAEGYGSTWIVTLGLDAGIAVVYVVSTRNDSIRAVTFVPPRAPPLQAKAAQ